MNIYSTRSAPLFDTIVKVADVRWLALPSAAVNELEDIEKTLHDGRETTEASVNAAALSSCSGASSERGRAAVLPMPCEAKEAECGQKGRATFQEVEDSFFFFDNDPTNLGMSILLNLGQFRTFIAGQWPSQRCPIESLRQCV